MKKRIIKNILLTLTVLVMLCLLSLVVAAETTNTEGYYTYTVTDGNAIITTVDESINGDIVIPNTLGGYPVTEIGEFAFDECFGLTGISFPDTLTYIGLNAFEMTSLRTLYIPAQTKVDTSVVRSYYLTHFEVDANNPYCTTDAFGVLYSADMKTLLNYPMAAPMEEYTIPDGVTKIGNEAFGFAYKLKSLIMPDSLLHIGDRAFAYAGKLESIDMSDSLQTIGEYAFGVTPSISEITFPVTVKNIGFCAFAEDVFLKSITVKNYYTDLNDTFLGFTFHVPSDENIERIILFWEEMTRLIYTNKIEDENETEYINSLIESIEKCEETVNQFTVINCYEGSVAERYAIENNINYNTIVCEHSSETIPAVDPTCTQDGYSEGSVCKNCGLIFTAQEIIPANGHSMTPFIIIDRETAERTCKICNYTETRNVDFISTDNSIGAYIDGYYIYKIINNEAVILEADHVLSGNVTIPSTLGGCPVTEIVAYAFCECYEMTDVTIPETVRKIDHLSFATTKLSNIYIPATVEEIVIYDEIGAYRTNGYIVDANNPNYASDDNGVLFNKDMSSLLIAPLSLTSYIVPETVKTINACAFYFCTLLRDIELNDGLKEIGKGAFLGCCSLKEVVIPESVISIREYAFDNIIFLQQITILSENAAIGEKIFMYGEPIEMPIEKEIYDAFYEIYGKLMAAFFNCEYEEYEKYNTQVEALLNSSTETEFYYSAIHCYKGSTADIYATERDIPTFYLCKHKATVLAAVVPTCTENGLTEGSACEFCGEVYTAQEIIPATGHTMSAWANDYDAGIAARECKNCDYNETIPLTDQGDDSVDIIAPENPELDFDVDNIDQNSDTFILVQNVVLKNLGKNYEVLKVFDITLKNKDGVHVQPDGCVKVKLPLDWEKDGNYKVYRINTDGTLTDMDAFRQGSHMVFETDHFSIYAIVQKISIEEDPSTGDDTTDNNKPQGGYKDLFAFLTRLIEAITEFFMTILELMGF
ncbi:MAG: leucine-rich repeat domain-containing protein [Clostridia bacterium]|nr:leucine-rich repeat domain-containing protein [Clostridia bacterium]